MKEVLTLIFLFSIIAILSGGVIGCIRAIYTQNVRYIIVNICVMWSSFLVGILAGIGITHILRMMDVGEKTENVLGISIWVFIALIFHVYDFVQNKFSVFYFWNMFDN